MYNQASRLYLSQIRLLLQNIGNYSVERLEVVVLT